MISLTELITEYTVEPRYNEGAKGLTKYVCYNEVSLYQGSFPYILQLLGQRIMFFIPMTFVIQMFVKSRTHCMYSVASITRVHNLTVTSIL